MTSSLFTERDTDALMLDKLAILQAAAASIILELSPAEAAEMSALLRDGLRFRAGWRAIRDAGIRKQAMPSR